MTDKQYGRHFKEVIRISKKTYYRDITFDPNDIINSAFVLMTERGILYNEETFFKMLWSVMAKQLYDRKKSNKYAWANHLKYGNCIKAEYRKKASPWYIQHLLLKKYTLEEINANPQLAEEKKKEILNRRNNNNQPIENELPTIPKELIDLSLINPEYKGYGITMQGELYSCKALFKTDVMFTQMWRPIAKRKNGCIRLNIKGVKKELGIKSVLKEIQSNHILNTKEIN